MTKQSLGTRIISALLALALIFGVCPTTAFSAETKAGVHEDQGVRLPFTQVEDVDAVVNVATEEHNQESGLGEQTDVVISNVNYPYCRRQPLGYRAPGC